LLDFEPPNYRFHPVLVDKAGKRFAKRNRSATLKKLREDGKTSAEIRKMIGLL